MSLLRTVCSSRPPARPTPRGSKFAARQKSQRQSAHDRRVRRCRGDDSGDQRSDKPRSAVRERAQLPEDEAECLAEDGRPQTTESPPKRQKHGLVTAVAFAALAGALAVCDIDAHDVLPHFTDLQLSLLLDELDYTTLMLIDVAMRHVAGVPHILL